MSSKVPENIEDAPTTVRGMFPGLWWNKDRVESRRNRVADLRDSIKDADAIGVVDSDADGAACEVVLRDKFDNPSVIVANGSEHGIYLSHALRIISEEADENTTVYVADLSPDSTFSSFLASLSTIDSPVQIYDHHDWDWNALESIRAVVEDITINEELCAAQILQENIHEEANENIREFLEVTADHDLWIKEDKRSDHLSTLSFRLSREEYVSNALKYGANMVEESEDLRELYEESERKANKRAEIATDNADWIDINGTSIAITYFDCHQSRTGERLIQQGADLAVITQPTLSVSFRSTEEFGKCADLARSLGGGGHEDSAGASIYKELEVDESVDAEELVYKELNESSDDIDKDDMDLHEFIWRTEGTQTFKFMKEHLRAELGE
jgi:oligoribonuclease NrnB/cAMP/cGMP phosphodiesterase (DHH superfamily)